MQAQTLAPELPQATKQEKSDQHKLAAEIIARSEADTWYKAKLEWTLESVFYTEAESLETCLCGHWPIRELCELAIRRTATG